MKGKAILIAVLCLASAACQQVRQSGPEATLPEEWLAEAQMRLSEEWVRSGTWIDRELFPCDFCYGFHGTVDHVGGPAHLVPDHRQAILCEDCQGVGRRVCEPCRGRGGVRCTQCLGFGIVDCPDCEMVRVEDVKTSHPIRSDKVVSRGCPACEFAGGACEACRIQVPNLDHLPVVERGDIRYTSVSPCRTCRSRGWGDCPECREGIKPCETCEGTGFEGAVCPICGGHGVFWPRRIEFKLQRLRDRGTDKE